MDTDDFTTMAYEIIVGAATVSDTLKAELGAMAYTMHTEDEWLKAAYAHLQKIKQYPDEYVEHWNLTEEEGVTDMMIKDCATQLCERIHEILVTPLKERGESF